MIGWIGESAPTSRRLLESILAEEEEHADGLNDLLGNCVLVQRPDNIDRRRP